MQNPIHLKRLDQTQIKEWLALYDTIITDCDAVLWHDDEVIPQAPETINKLKSLGKNIYFVTNNGVKTRRDLWLKATQMNFLIDESHIIAPTYSIAEYLKSNLNREDKVYVIGSSAITQELNTVNIESFGSGEDLVQDEWYDTLASIKKSPERERVGAVVVGFDEHFSFMKMLKACSFLSGNPKCYFLATNTDAVHRYPEYCIPGTGAILESLQTCVGKKATVMGKPNALICENLVLAEAIDPKRTLMIGDCAKVDVLFGKNCDFKTLLVGTGGFSWSKLQTFIQNKETDFIPDYYLDSLGDLLAFLE